MQDTTEKLNKNYKNNDINCFIITEGIAGTENQCIAIAERLGVSYSVKRIALQHPFKNLCPFIFKTAPKAFIKGIDWNEPEPDLVIAAGRKAIPVTLQFKKAFKVFIQNPKISPSYFDLVAAPEHDKLDKGENVISTTAAPNRVTSHLLKQASAKFDFSALPEKKVAVLIGGNSKTHTMPHNFAEILRNQLSPFMQSNEYGFMVTSSRRTPIAITENLQALFDNDHSVYWNGKGDNPYHAYLANADYILVTEDSTSMLSDACSTGKPVYRLALNGGSSKFNYLYTALEDRCGLKVFKGQLDDWNYTPLNDAQLVADEIKKRFAKMHGTS